MPSPTPAPNTSTRTKNHMRYALLAMIPLTVITTLSAAEVELIIEPTPLHAVDQRLFGQFMERPLGGETGPEGVCDANGVLPEPVVQALADMRIPVVRFPAGTDVDYTDWTYLIDRAPGRAIVMREPTHGMKPQPLVTAHFGWHEYARLSDRLGWQTIAVVNLLDGLAKRKPLADAARHAAGMIAYLNAPLGAKLPEGMPDWPAIRAANGHPEPFKVRYFQIGNEWFLYHKTTPLLKELSEADFVAWYTEVLRTYVTAIRAVDPTVELIIDAETGRGMGPKIISDPLLRREVAWAAIHAYAPMRDISKDTGTPDEFWRYWSSIPGMYDATGQNQSLGDKRSGWVRKLGYRIAVTEWNWNGWGKLAPEFTTHQRRAQGIGAAGFIHGMMREGEAIGLATQSMLLGIAWSFAAIKIDATGRMLRAPQGHMTTFYNKHHGESLLNSTLSGVSIAPMPNTWGGNEAMMPVAQIDALATGGKNRVFAHVVNRTLTTQQIRITVPATLRTATVHRMLPCAVEEPDADHWFTEDSVPATVVAGICHIELPGAAVMAVEFTAAP